MTSLACALEADLRPSTGCLPMIGASTSLSPPLLLSFCRRLLDPSVRVVPCLVFGRKSAGQMPQVSVELQLDVIPLVPGRRNALTTVREAAWPRRSRLLLRRRHQRRRREDRALWGREGIADDPSFLVFSRNRSRGRGVFRGAAVDVRKVDRRKAAAGTRAIKTWTQRLLLQLLHVEAALVDPGHVVGALRSSAGRSGVALASRAAARHSGSRMRREA